MWRTARQTLLKIKTDGSRLANRRPKFSKKNPKFNNLKILYSNCQGLASGKRRDINLKTRSMRENTYNVIDLAKEKAQV